MRNIVKFFLERKLMVNLIVILVIISGLLALNKIPREGLPNVDIMQVLINTRYPGASPEDVELNVTIPIEDELKSIEGIQDLYSVSKENFSNFKIMLNKNLSSEEAKEVKEDIQKAIDDVTDLPKEVTERPKLTELRVSLFPVMEVAIQGNNELELRSYTKKLERKINHLKNISDVILVGYKDREVKILANPQKLIDNEISLSEIINAIQKRNIRMSGGTMESYENERTLVTIEEFNNEKQVENSIIRANFDGKVLRVKDVAKVKKDFTKQDLIVRSNGQPSISLCIIKNENSDIIRTVQSVKNLLLKEQMPKGISYEVVNDESAFTKNRLKIVVNNAIIGMFLVFGMLLIFLNFRTAAWTAFGIPFSLFITFMLLPKFDVTFNIICLGGFIIVIGMLVDDAIVVGENIQRHREEGERGYEAILNAVMEIIKPVSTTIFTTIIAFAPLLYMSGMMGRFMYSLPITVILALCASFFESIFILPSHLAYEGEFKSKPRTTTKKRGLIVKLQKHYRSLLKKVLKHRYLTTTSGGLIFIGVIIFAITQMQFTLMPKGAEEAFFIKLYAEKGTSLEKMTELVKPIEKLMQQLPTNELENVESRIGYDGDIYWATKGGNNNYAAVYIYLQPSGIRSRNAEDIINDAKTMMEPYKHKFTNIVYAYSQTKGPPSDKPIIIQVMSENNEDRQAAYKDLKKYLQNIDGVIDIEDDIKIGKDEIKLEIDHKKLAQLGLDALSVAATIRTAYEGTIVSSIRDANEEIDFRVQLAPEFREDIKYLMNLPVRNYLGKLVRIKNFATIAKGGSSIDINRYDRMRSITIKAEIDSTKTTPMAINSKLSKHIKSLIKKYPDVYFETGGEGEETKESFQDLGKLFILSLFGIYFILVLLFNSFLQPIMVMTAIPLSLISVIIAFYFHGQEICFPALVGFVGLSGVVVNDSLIMVSYINSIHKKSESNKEFLESIVDGAITRLRPILLTTFTTVAGVIPMIYGWGGTDEFIIPMAMTLGYGLLGSTVLILFVVPCLLMIHHDFIVFFKKK